MTGPVAGAGRPRLARAARALLTGLSAAVLVACASAPTVEPVARPGAGARVAYLASDGWHAGIVIDRASLEASGLVPEAADFPGARYLEFGWGDRDFYMTPDETLGMTLRAAFVPTSAVLHVAPLGRPPAAGPGIDVLRLVLSAAEHERLVRAVSGSFDRPAQGRTEPVAPGPWPGSRFYPATGRFHVFNTCNTWVARLLAAAGVRIWPPGIVAADTLMARVREATGQR